MTQLHKFRLFFLFVFLLVSCGRPTTPFDRQDPLDPASEEYNPGFVSDLNFKLTQNGALTLQWDDHSVFLEEGYLIEKSVNSGDDYQEIGQTKHTHYTDDSIDFSLLNYYRVTPFVYRSGNLLAPSPKEIQIRLSQEDLYFKFNVLFDWSSETISIVWDVFPLFNSNLVVVIEVKASNNEDYRTLISGENFKGKLTDQLEDMSFDNRQYKISLKYEKDENEVVPLHLPHKTSDFNPHIFYTYFISHQILNGNTISLKWADNSFFEDGFKIYRSIAILDEFELVADLPPNTTEYQDSFDFESGDSYRYRLHAYTEHTKSPSRYHTVTIP